MKQEELSELSKRGEIPIIGKDFNNLLIIENTTL